MQYKLTLIIVCEMREMPYFLGFAGSCYYLILIIYPDNLIYGQA